MLPRKRPKSSLPQKNLPRSSTTSEFKKPKKKSSAFAIPPLKKRRKSVTQPWQMPRKLVMQQKRLRNLLGMMPRKMLKAPLPLLKNKSRRFLTVQRQMQNCWLTRRHRKQSRLLQMRKERRKISKKKQFVIQKFLMSKLRSLYKKKQNLKMKTESILQKTCRFILKTRTLNLNAKNKKKILTIKPHCTKKRLPILKHCEFNLKAVAERLTNSLKKFRNLRLANRN